MIKAQTNINGTLEPCIIVDTLSYIQSSYFIVAMFDKDIGMGRLKLVPITSIRVDYQSLEDACDNAGNKLIDVRIVSRLCD